jgi:hypothetical protein
MIDRFTDWLVADPYRSFIAEMVLVFMTTIMILIILHGS